MDLVKSKGLIIFLIVVLAITIVSSINTRKYDEKNIEIEDEYFSYSAK